MPVSGAHQESINSASIALLLSLHEVWVLLFLVSGQVCPLPSVLFPSSIYCLRLTFIGMGISDLCSTLELRSAPLPVLFLTYFSGAEPEVSPVGIDGGCVCGGGGTSHKLLL